MPKRLIRPLRSCVQSSGAMSGAGQPLSRSRAIIAALRQHSTAKPAFNHAMSGCRALCSARAASRYRRQSSSHSFAELTGTGWMANCPEPHWRFGSPLAFIQFCANWGRSQAPPAFHHRDGEGMAVACHALPFGRPRAGIYATGSRANRSCRSLAKQQRCPKVFCQ
jgi:hypothetical protein